MSTCFQCRSIKAKKQTRASFSLSGATNPNVSPVGDYLGKCNMFDGADRLSVDARCSEERTPLIKRALHFCISLQLLLLCGR